MQQMHVRVLSERFEPSCTLQYVTVKSPYICYVASLFYIMSNCRMRYVFSLSYHSLSVHPVCCCLIPSCKLTGTARPSAMAPPIVAVGWFLNAFHLREDKYCHVGRRLPPARSQQSSRADFSGPFGLLPARTRIRTTRLGLFWSSKEPASVRISSSKKSI